MVHAVVLITTCGCTDWSQWKTCKAVRPQNMSRTKRVDELLFPLADECTLKVQSYLSQPEETLEDYYNQDGVFQAWARRKTISKEVDMRFVMFFPPPPRAPHMTWWGPRKFSLCKTCPRWPLDRSQIDEPSVTICNFFLRSHVKIYLDAWSSPKLSWEVLPISKTFWIFFI